MSSGLLSNSGFLRRIIKVFTVVVVVVVVPAKDIADSTKALSKVNFLGDREIKLGSIEK